MNRSIDKGVKFALMTAFISGFSIFINKFAVGSITPPLVFTTTKNLAVGVLIIALLIVTKRWLDIKKLSKIDSFRLLAIGIIGGSIPFYLFFTGISMIPAVNAALIHKTLVFWVALLAWPFLGEKLSKTQAVAILVLFGSNFLVGGFEGFTFSRGELLVLLATLLWSVENIIAKKTLDHVHPDVLTAARMGFGSLVLLGLSVAIAPSGLVGVLSLSGTQTFWLFATVLALFAYVSTWYRALSLAPVTTVATVLVSSTIITNALSAVFITGSLTPEFIPQTIFITLGLVLFVLGDKIRSKPALEKSMRYKR